MANEPSIAQNGAPAGAPSINPSSTISTPSAPAPAATSTADANALKNAFAAQVRPGGAPARVFLNEKVVPYLLEGMKAITRDQPPNPLHVLGEFLIQKSNEVEGNTSSNLPSCNKSPE